MPARSALTFVEFKTPKTVEAINRDIERRMSVLEEFTEWEGLDAVLAKTGGPFQHLNTTRVDLARPRTYRYRS